MGNNRFKFSSMLPNAWFYKLKDMSKRRSKGNSNQIPKKLTTAPKPIPSAQQQPYLPNRTSSYLPTKDRSHKTEKLKPSTDILLDQPRRSKRLNRRPLKPTITNHVNCDCKSSTPAPELRRIKIRPSSPRLVTKRIDTTKAKLALQQKKCLSESFAIIKSSMDPEKDFRESMTEMIVENSILSSKDLEELLACYLSLNSDEHHLVIVKVFKQLWFKLADIRVH